MAKRINHCEKICKAGLNGSGYWHIKLQTYPGSFTRNPADYIVLAGRKRHLLECKESKSGRFEFSRLTQEEDLIKFDKADDLNYSKLVLLFWNKTFKKSHLFVIDINTYMGIKRRSKKKSMNCKELLEWGFISIKNLDEYFIERL